MNPTRILVAEDVRLVNEGIATLLEKQPDLTVTGQVFDGESCLQFLDTHTVDLVLLDHKMPRKDGLETLKAIRAADCPVKVILLTLLTEEHMVRRYLEAGIDGCLLKQDSPDEFVFGVKQVIRGETYYSSAVAQVIMNLNRRRSRLAPHQQANLDQLTRSEWEVLALIGKGLSAKEVSEVRHRSIQTINKQKQSIMNKLGIHKETKLMKFALEFGVL